MADRKSVLVQIHVSQSDRVASAGASAVKTVVGTTATDRRSTRAGTGAEPRGGAAGALPASVERSWAVAFGGQKYLVLDAGPKGLTMTRDGTAVWSGRRLESGSYETRTTTLPHDRLERVLRLVRVGDERTPKLSPAVTAKEGVGARHERTSARRVGAEARAATPSKREGQEARASERAPGRSARARHRPAHSAHETSVHEAPSSKREANTANPRPDCPPARRRTPPRSATRPSRRPVATVPTSGAPSEALAAPVAKRKPGRPRKPSATTPVTKASSPASTRRDRAPATTRSVRSAHMDDATVLAEVKKKVKREDPENALSLYDALERIWRAGGREATAAWMASQKMTNVVDAFSDWVDKNPEAARALLEKAAASKRGAAA